MVTPPLEAGGENATDSCPSPGVIPVMVGWAAASWFVPHASQTTHTSRHRRSRDMCPPRPILRGASQRPEVPRRRHERELSNRRRPVRVGCPHANGVLPAVALAMSRPSREKRRHRARATRASRESVKAEGWVVRGAARSGDEDTRIDRTTPNRASTTVRHAAFRATGRGRTQLRYASAGPRSTHTWDPHTPGIRTHPRSVADAPFRESPIRRGLRDAEAVLALARGDARSR